MLKLLPAARAEPTAADWLLVLSDWLLLWPMEPLMEMGLMGAALALPPSCSMLPCWLVLPAVWLYSVIPGRY
jgi:hypothetical protein